MKYIAKSSVEPLSLSDWKLQDKMYQRGNATWKRFRTVGGREYKKEFTQDLIVEQGYICCYCEQKLNINDCHIEHLLAQNKDLYSKFLFDYQNLLCSCQLEIESGEPRHCGNSKGNNILPITPLMPDCENKFKYTEDGYIEYTDENSRLTVEYLQLDIDKLNKLRESAIDSIRFIDPIEKDELLSEEESKQFAERYLQVENGEFKEFYTTIKYLFG
jgi:uncharacterized protein (TIGR02646 family)